MPISCCFGDIEWHKNTVNRKLVAMGSPLWYRKHTFRSFIYCQSSTIPVNFVKIGLVDIEIIGLKEITKIFLKHELIWRTYSSHSASSKPGGLNYHLVTFTDELHFIWETIGTIDYVYQTTTGKGTYHAAVCCKPHTHCLPNQSRCRSLCQQLSAVVDGPVRHSMVSWNLINASLLCDENRPTQLMQTDRRNKMIFHYYRSRKKLK